MLRQRIRHSRDEVASICLIVRMLKLTATALRKVTAWRHLMVRAGFNGAIVEKQIAWHGKGGMLSSCRDAVTTRRNSNDRLGHQSC
jgi:hypothetical protein